MSYVDYDDLGAVEIRCMNCGAPIVVRTYRTMMVRSIPPKEVRVMAMHQLSSYRKRRFELLDNSYVTVMLCNNCVDLPLDPDKMERAIEEGWKTTWKHEHKSEKEIKQLKKALPVLEDSIRGKKRKKQCLMAK